MCRRQSDGAALQHRANVPAGTFQDFRAGGCGKADARPTKRPTGLGRCRVQGNRGVYKNLAVALGELKALPVELPSAYFDSLGLPRLFGLTN